MSLRIVIGSVVAFAAVAAGPAGAADGTAVWKQHCAKCHGETGHADAPVAKALKVPVIAGNATVAAMTPADVVKAFKANPKHGTVKVSDEELEAAAAHVKELAAKK